VESRSYPGMPAREALKRPSTGLSDAKEPRHWQYSLPAVADATRPNRIVPECKPCAGSRILIRLLPYRVNLFELLRVLELHSPCINRRILWGAFE